MTEQIEDAFKLLENLKKFQFPLEDGLDECVNSFHIEDLSYHTQRYRDISWRFTEYLVNLVKLEINSEFEASMSFLNYLKLGRLEHLGILYCKFSSESMSQFFKELSLLKKLKVLKVSNLCLKNPILNPNIETLHLEIGSAQTRIDFYSLSARDLGKFISQFLPLGLGIKVLRVELRRLIFGFPDLEIDLKSFYPKLVKAKMNFSLLENEGYKVVEMLDPLCEEIWD